jgi:hypothetical protein
MHSLLTKPKHNFRVPDPASDIGPVERILAVTVLVRCSRWCRVTRSCQGALPTARQPSEFACQLGG